MASKLLNLQNLGNNLLKRELDVSTDASEWADSNMKGCIPTTTYIKNAEAGLYWNLMCKYLANGNHDGAQKTIRSLALNIRNPNEPDIPILFQIKAKYEGKYAKIDPTGDPIVKFIGIGSTLVKKNGKEINVSEMALVKTMEKADSLLTKYEEIYQFNWTLFDELEKWSEDINHVITYDDYKHDKMISDKFKELDNLNEEQEEDWYKETHKLIPEWINRIKIESFKIILYCQYLKFTKTETINNKAARINQMDEIIKKEPELTQALEEFKNAENKILDDTIQYYKKTELNINFGERLLLAEEAKLNAGNEGKKVKLFTVPLAREKRAEKQAEKACEMMTPEEMDQFCVNPNNAPFLFFLAAVMIRSSYKDLTSIINSIFYTFLKVYNALYGKAITKMITIDSEFPNFCSKLGTIGEPTILSILWGYCLLLKDEQSELLGCSKVLKAAAALHLKYHQMSLIPLLDKAEKQSKVSKLTICQQLLSSEFATQINNYYNFYKDYYLDNKATAMFAYARLVDSKYFAGFSIMAGERFVKVLQYMIEPVQLAQNSIFLLKTETYTGDQLKRYERMAKALTKLGEQNDTDEKGIGKIYKDIMTDKDLEEEKKGEVKKKRRRNQPIINNQQNNEEVDDDVPLGNRTLF